MRHKGGQRKPVYQQSHTKPETAHAQHPTESEKVNNTQAPRDEKTINPSLDQKQTKEQRDENRYQIKDRRERFTLYWVAAYTIITTFLLLISICQTIITHDTEVSSGRAWLQPKEFSFGDFQYGKTISITGKTENVGHEPALGVDFRDPRQEPGKYFGFIDITPEAWVDPYAIPIPRDDICDGLATRDTGVIFPGEKLSYERYIRPNDSAYPRESQFQAVKDGKAIFFWRDCVAYYTFGQRHRSGFCHYLMRKVTTGQVTESECWFGKTAD